MILDIKRVTDGDKKVECPLERAGEEDEACASKLLIVLSI